VGQDGILNGTGSPAPRSISEFSFHSCAPQAHDDKLAIGRFLQSRFGAFGFLVVTAFLREKHEDLGLKPFGWQGHQSVFAPMADLQLSLRPPAFLGLGR
jgi:hypothetical protein